MNRIALKTAMKAPHFIGSWLMEEPLLCDGLIEYFESNTLKQRKGVVTGGYSSEIKTSRDISISPKALNQPGHEVFHTYFDHLFSWGDHFQQVHTERSNMATLHRVLAWMTYLNDVEEGGSTYFQHYDIDIQPKKGLTLLWPAEWTHAHRGNVLKMGQKYIITGWLHFGE
jgi:prolyl 4-hydroxylase